MGITVKILVVTDDELRACQADPNQIHLIFHSTREHQYVHEARRYAETLRRGAEAGELVRIPGVSEPTYIIENAELGDAVKMQKYVPDHMVAVARANNQGLLLHEFEDW